MGTFTARCRWSSREKQRGETMSSRQKAPKVGASIVTAWINWWSLVTRRHIGRASIPPNVLQMTALPSMAGRVASGPMDPRPKSAEPSVIKATVFPRQVYSNEAWGSLWMARQGSATPGV